VSDGGGSLRHRPGVFLALGFTLGIVLENLWGALPLLMVLTAGLGVAFILARVRRTFFSGAVFVFLVVCGAFDAWSKGLMPADHISRVLKTWQGRQVEVVCRVASLPEEKAKGLAPKKVFVCDLDPAAGIGRSGRVLVNFYGAGHVEYGDRVRLAGKLSRPVDHFSGGNAPARAHGARPAYEAVLHVSSTSRREVLGGQPSWTCTRFALAVRCRLEDVFRRYLSPGEAGLMNAMLLGPRGEIPSHVYDVFRKTGTAHIIAISGMNMTLAAAGVMLVLGVLRIPRRPRAVLAALILGFYALMAGNSAPVLRSALMAGAVILGFVAERESDMINSLALAALVILAVDPGELGDIGFQLSFVCVASLIGIVPVFLTPLEGLGWRKKPLVWFLAESAAVTLAAFIGSAGILAYAFGYLTPVGLMVNLPVIPLMALVTGLGAALLTAGFILPVAAVPFALGLKVLLNAAVGVLVAAAQAPVLACPDLSGWFLWVYYGAVLAALGYFQVSSQVKEPGAFIDKEQPL